jgi:hypothetical protein
MTGRILRHCAQGREKRVHIGCHFSPQTPHMKRSSANKISCALLCFALLLALPSSSSSTIAQFAELC